MQSLKLLLVGLVVLGALASWADDPPEFVCGDEGGGGMPPLEGVVKAYIVYISYPGDPDSLVPPSASHTINEVMNWLAFATNGKQTLDLSVLRRLDHPDRAWKLGAQPDYPCHEPFGDPPNRRCLEWPCQNYDTEHDRCLLQPEMSTYIGNQSQWAVANLDVFRRIYNHYKAAAPNAPSIWENVDRVFMLHYQCVTTKTPAEPCGQIYGTAGLFHLAWPEPEWNFWGLGATLSFLPGEVTAATVPRMNAGVVHEYGHTIQHLHHSPFSGNPPSYDENGDPPENIPFGSCGASCGNWTYVNIGRYDTLRGIAGYGGGLVGFHPYQMARAGWAAEIEITNDVEGLHVPDVHGTNPQNPAKVFRVVPRNPVPGAAQAFLLANHQQTGLDYRLEGYGLLIWHLLRAGDEQDFRATAVPTVKAWDLESAQGKFDQWDPFTWTPSSPNPVAGRDHLEADWCWGGSALDFFNDGQLGDPIPPPPEHDKTVMACDTNPNTNLYASADFTSGIPSQLVPTSIAFENIHKDPYSTDMIVDVFVTPKQKVLFPNGSQEYVASGEPWTIQWSVRPHACVTGIELAISTDHGLNYALLASPLANSGSYATIGPPVAGCGYRVKVTSHNATPTTGEDASDADFTVWNIPATSISHSDLIVHENGTFSVTINWQTTVSANDLDELLLTPPPEGSSVGTYVNSINGLNHAMTFTGTCTTGMWTYVVKSRRPRFATGDPKSIATGPAKTFRLSYCLEM